MPSARSCSARRWTGHRRGGHDPAVTGRQPALRFILLVVLLDVLGFGLLIPVGPDLVMKLQGGTEKDAAPVVGWLMATFSLMAFLGAPLLGALSDRFGRRPVLLVSMFGSGLDYFAMALAPNLSWLFVTRAINGLSGASITVANAYIADVTPPEKRAAAYGMFGAAFGVGFVAGPLLGGLLGDLDIHYPFYAAGLLTLLNGVYGALVLPESLPPVRRSLHAVHSPVAALAVFRGYPLVRRLAVAIFLVNMAQFALHATWRLYTRHRYGWDPGDVGWSLFAVGIGAFVVQGGLARHLVPRLGERRAIVVGLVFAVFAYVGYAVATEGWMIYVAIAVAACGGLAMPAMQSLITRNVRPDQQGAVQGGLTSAQSLANIVGPLLGAWLFAWSIDPAHEGAHPGTVFFASAALAAAGLVAAILTLRNPPGTAPSTGTMP
jgi:DHA1 family tetracycline resistance protein-like MFS transporter